MAGAVFDQRRWKTFMKCKAMNAATLGKMAISRCSRCNGRYGRAPRHETQHLAVSHAVQRRYVPTVGAPIAAGQADVACAWAAAAARRQSRHRQSPPVVGIGSFAGSSAHQQSPERSQPNSVLQPAQVRRRLGGASTDRLRLPLRFVI
jgi:hypothetical protein